jgi:hypothetical protein
MTNAAGAVEKAEFGLPKTGSVDERPAIQLSFSGYG